MNPFDTWDADGMGRGLGPYFGERTTNRASERKAQERMENCGNWKYGIDSGGCEMRTGLTLQELGKGDAVEEQVKGLIDDSVQCRHTNNAIY